MEVTAHLQQNLDRIWKCARWIRDVTTYARNREKKSGIHLSHILSGSSVGGGGSIPSGGSCITVNRGSEGGEDGGGGDSREEGGAGGGDSKSKMSAVRLSQGAFIQNHNNQNTNCNHSNSSGNSNSNNNNNNISRNSNFGLGPANYRNSTSSLSSNTSSSSMCSQSGYRLSVGGRRGRGDDVRLMAKFFDPNEANPHSTDSISICRGHTRSADVSPTTQPSRTSTVGNFSLTNLTSASTTSSKNNASFINHGPNKSPASNSHFGKSFSCSSALTSDSVVDCLSKTPKNQTDSLPSNSAHIPHITSSPSLSSISTAVSSASSSSSSYAIHPTGDHREENPIYKITSSGTSSGQNEVAHKTVARRSYSADLDVSSHSLSTSSSSSQQHLTLQHYPRQQDQSQQDFEALDNAIVKVHAMYETGLKRNVNIKLHISEQTTARDIVNLVVRHLNSVVQRKGKGASAYPEDALQDFCLVLIFQDGRKAVLGNEDTPLSLGGQLHRAKVCVTMLEPVLSRRRVNEGRPGAGYDEDDDDDDGLGQATIV